MKLLVVSAVAGLFFSLAGSTPANTLKTDPDPGEKTERAMPVSPQLTVTLCVASGTLTVNGSDKNELRVTTSAKSIEFRRLDKPRDPSAPASRIDVIVFESAAKVGQKVVDCQSVADVEMVVPSGASVLVQTRDGDVSISGVAAAYAGSQNGNIEIERATKLVEAGSVGGSITLRDSSGRVNLSSAGGSVEVFNVKAADSDDTFEVGTVSGDIQLNGVANPKVMAKTVNGTMTMLGPLTKSGHYVFNNMTGDVVLGLPHDASFKLSAKVSERRDIVSDFALKYLPDAPPPPATPSPGPPNQGGATPKPGPAVAKGHPQQKPGPVITPGPIEKPVVVVPHVLRRVNAICGSGDATILVASFGGTVRLKKL